MTKRIQATLAAILVMSTISVRAQLTTTTRTSKPNSSTTRTTVTTTDRSRSHSSAASRKHRAARTTAHRESPLERQIRELREQMVQQQSQIDALRQQNADKDARLASASADAAAATSAAANAQQQSQNLQTLIEQNRVSVSTLSSDVGNIKLNNAGLAQTLADTKRDLTDRIESPTTIHYKGVTIQPVAFFALEGVYRTRAINSGLNTPFNTTPFPGSNEGHISEENLSGRQSRIGALFEGNAGGFKLQGYVEADFLSAGVTSNENQSNSYTLRQRQIWGRAETKSGFAVTGGQMWSLVTENGRGTDNRTEKLPNTIDPQYMVGYNWARQPAIRFQQKIGHPYFGAATTVAISLEQGQTQFAGANAPNNFIFGGSGVGGGLFNSTATYANNVAPDVVAKVAFDAKHGHFEIGGLARFFRDQYYPVIVNPATGLVTAYSTNLHKDTKTGGGVFGTGRVITKYADVAFQGMYGDGTARYGSSQLGDVTVHPDGELEPIRNSHGLFTLETHPNKKLDVYAYYGAEYNQRTYYPGYGGVLVGYAPPNLNNSGCYKIIAPTVGNGGNGVGGSPSTANCAEPTKLIQEGTIGYTYRIVNSPKYGRLQYQATYSYLQRSNWTGLTGGTFNTPSATFGSGRATNNLIYAGMRYYIP